MFKNLLTILFAFLISNIYGQNTSIQLDGVAEHLVVPHNDNQNIKTQFTLEAWIFANNWKNEVWRGSIITKDNQSPDRGYAFRCGDNGNLSMVISVDNTWEEVIGTTQMGVKQWHHVAAVVNGNSVKIYIDGTEVGSGTFNGDPIANTSDLFIGGSNFSGRFFDGAIDEVRIWNTARTQQELADNKEVDLTGNEAGLVLYLPMNEGSGSIANNIADPSSNATGIGIDDSNWIEGYTLPDFDLSINSIRGLDRINMKTRPVRLMTQIQNLGLNPMTNISLDLFVNGQKLFTENVTESIAPGELLTYRFTTPVDLTEIDDVDLEIILNHPDDQNGLNNNVERLVNNMKGPIVSLLDKQQHNNASAGQNHFFNLELPEDLEKYRRINMHISVDCPTGGCDPWDQPAQVTAMTENGSIEIARYITPFGIACGPWIVNITDFMPILKGDNDMRSFVQVWGPSGWLVSLDLEFLERSDSNDAIYRKVTPLWRSDYLVYGDPNISHDLPEMTVSTESITDFAKMRMQITGHGQGNTDNAAEFAIKQHYAAWDDVLLDAIFLFASCGNNDCADQNGSWLFDRAGWCPGSAVSSRDFYLGGLDGGSDVKLDFVLQDYTNLLNTGYNGESHTEPHLRLHGYLIEESATRYNDLTNLMVSRIEPIISNGEITNCNLTVVNNGSTAVSNFTVNGFHNNNPIFRYDLNMAIPSGDSIVYNAVVNPNTSLLPGDNLIFAEVQNDNDENLGDNIIKTVEKGSVATNDVESLSLFSVQPNPSKGNLNLQFDEQLLDGVLSIYTLNGLLVNSFKITSTQHHVQLTQQGSYILKVVDTEGQTSSKKHFVIK